MTKILSFDLGEPGVSRRWIDNEDGTVTILSSQDAAPLLDLNKAMANENDGYTPSRDMRRLASIPAVLMEAWAAEVGHDKDALKELVLRRLNDADYQWLRTSPYKVA